MMMWPLLFIHYSTLLIYSTYYKWYTYKWREITLAVITIRNTAGCRILNADTCHYSDINTWRCLRRRAFYHCTMRTGTFAAAATWRINRWYILMPGDVLITWPILMWQPLQCLILNDTDDTLILRCLSEAVSLEVTVVLRAVGTLLHIDSLRPLHCILWFTHVHSVLPFLWPHILIWCDDSDPMIILSGYHLIVPPLLGTLLGTR